MAKIGYARVSHGPATDGQLGELAAYGCDEIFTGTVTGAPGDGARQQNRTRTPAEFCRRGKVPQSGRSWDLLTAERYRRRNRHRLL